MTTTELLELVVVDPQICFGKPTIRGHRIWVSLVLGYLAEGWTPEQIVEEYPRHRDRRRTGMRRVGSAARGRLICRPRRRGVKFKLDENLGARAVRAFRDAGHDTSSVRLQNLAGAPDQQVFAVCRAENRVLVTLDLDFATPLTFDPARPVASPFSGCRATQAPSEITAAIGGLFRRSG